MKKFTSLLMLFCAFVGSAWAQKVITDLNELSNGKVYTIIPKHDVRGAMYATATSTHLDACGGTLGGAKNPSIAVDATSADQQFALYTHEGSTYLYSIGAGKYVSDVSVSNTTYFPLVEKPGFPVTVVESNAEGYFIIKVKGSEFVNVSTGWTYGCVGGWNNTDDGNRLCITEVADIPAEALAKITADFSKQVALTYVYKTGAKEWKRETVVAEKGEAYPAPASMVGVTFTLPEGNVPAETENGAEVVVECVIEDLPFNVSTLTDGKFGEGMSWYYLKMRSKDVTYDAATGKALTGNVDEKGIYNLFAFTGNPFEGFSIYTYVAGPDKVLWRENADNGGRVFFTEISETDGNTWMLSKNGDAGYVFRLNGNENGYLNDHKPDLAIWNHSAGATDGGSTITFEYVANPDLTILYDITYQFVYGGNVIDTKTITVESGAEFPAHGYVAPYGVTVGEKPAGNVSASGTHQITLTVSKELPFKTASDVNSIDTWYYARMHTNQPGYIGDIADDKTVNVAWGKSSDEYNENYLWGFAGNIWDGITVVNKGTGLQLTSTGGGNATLTASGTAFFVAPTTETTQNATNGFCLRKKDSNQYLNANYGTAKLSHWSSTDAGSTMFLTEYNETEVVVSKAGYATLFLGQATYIPAEVEVYAVTATNGGWATMTAVEGVLPANTGVILKNEGTYTFKTAAATGSVEGNLLLGSVEDTYVEGPAYVLSNQEGVVGLYKATLNKNAEGAEGETHFLNNANKAYLPVAASGARFLGFDFGTETGIGEVETETENAVIFDLAGRRVQKAQKGLYIVNGKKVIR